MAAATDSPRGKFFHKPSDQLTTEETYEWAVKNELECYGIPDLIKENDISGSILLALSEYTMKNQLGILSYGARFNFMNCIQALKDLEIGAEGSKADHQYLIKDYGIGQYLSQVPLLESLSIEDRAKIGAGVQFKTFNTGEILVKQGQRPESFFIIREGCVQARVMTTSGSVSMVARLHCGDFFGEEGLVRREVAPATIVAEIHTEVWMINIKYARCVLRQSRVLKNIPHREAISAEEINSVTANAPQNTIRKKEESTKAIIMKSLQKNCLFETIDKEQIQSCVEMMWQSEIPAGDTPIKQGEHGDYFYVIENGLFEVLVTDDKGFTLPAAELGPSDSFGELALMYDASRSASVRACVNSVVWVLDRSNFRRILLSFNAVEMQRRENFLKSVEILNHLLPTEISVLANACETKHFEKGEIIFRQGDPGDSFMVVEDGEVKCTKDDQVLCNLTVGNFFGERALIKEENRAATVECVKDTKVLFLDRHAFRLLLGPLHKIMHRNIEDYENEFKKVLANEKEHETFQIDVMKLVPKAILGCGAFGEVRLVEYSMDDGRFKSFALKKVSKTKTNTSGQKTHIQNERKYMMLMDSYFIVKLYETFESKSNLYFLMEPCLGGELFTYIRDGGAMSENDSQFYVACVILGLQHMHSHKVIYRDLKPENLMVSDTGYVKITDLGFAKRVKFRTYTLCGTPDYLAPEVIGGKGHSFGVDWWTVGILIYELLYSFPPFYEGNHMKTYKRILHENIKYPSNFSSSAKLLISGLLQKKPTQRLGVVKGGIKKIKRARWFANFDWNALETLQMTAPQVPNIKDLSDTSNFDDYPDKSKRRLSVFATSEFERI